MSAPIAILEYHGVDPVPTGKYKRFLFVTPRQFGRQLSLLHSLGIQCLSLTEALREHRAGNGRVVAITFDDAYADIFVHALPCLLEHRFTATAFVVSGRIGSFNTWDAEDLGVRKPTMSADQLLAWRGHGMEVGAHTRTHARLTELPDAVLDDEIAGSRYDLEQLLGDQVLQFCYPYGAHDERAIAAVRKAGFSGAVTTDRRRARPEVDDCYRLPRINVRGDRPLVLFPFRTLSRFADRPR